MFDRAVLFLAWLADSWLIDAAVSPDKAKAAANTGVFYSAMAWLLLDTNWPSFTTSFSAKEIIGHWSAILSTFYKKFLMALLILRHNYIFCLPSTSTPLSIQTTPKV